MTLPRPATYAHRPWRRLVLCLLLLSIVQAAPAQQLRLELADGSRVRIEGTSSINTFTCEAAGIEGDGYLVGEARPGHRSVVAHVYVPVRQFDCGNPRMDADLRDALQAREHPQIRFRLRDARLIPGDGASGDDAGRFVLNVEGWVEIAGNARPVALRVEGRRLTDSSYHATGHLPLRMTDFGIEPPTALLGLVKVRDQITVHFDLVATNNAYRYITTRR